MVLGVIGMSEYDLMDLEEAKHKKGLFHINQEAFNMNYSNNPEANQMFNTSGGESNLTETEESLKALLVQHGEPTIEPPKQPNRRPHPRMSWIFTHGYGSRVRSENGHMVQCCVNDCGRLYITNNGSTSAFKKHLEKVHNLVEFPDPSRPHIGPNHGENGVNRARKPYAPRKGRMREILSVKPEAKAPQKTALPLPIAQDGQLLNLLQYGWTSVDRERLAPPSVLSDNRENFSKTQEVLKEIISSQLSISLSVDFWVNPHSEGVVCIMAHFISETWEPREVLLDMQIKKDMTGAEAANVLINSLDAYGATPLVSTITTNHSPMMQIMIEELGQLALSRSDFNFTPSIDHIPCLSFIINTAANGSLALGEQSPTGSIMEKLNKMRLGISSISKTPHALGFYQNLFRLGMQEHLALVADEVHRWDLTYQMAERLLLVHTFYNETCNSCGMSELAITQSDLQLLDDVKNLLGPLQAFAVRVSTQR
ncbi:Zinc finger BED domain-containing protein 1, variant 3 [Entomophthora muscae]|uniref:Zinc finger BED domain-containing protein 1, variant 3 n=1 Tax=Entomophthora muscae TaxID=34485 RepID=A0ACC2SV78_9FUNG|nr:Zinc finger BED domain-containing protein 1, variant 3 [Entomophthora muscae]